MDSDRILIHRMRQGDDAAWDQFIRKYYGDILKYCFFHCPDKTAAEDLTQEVFLRFFSALADYQHLGKAKHYLYTIAGNLCRDQARRNAAFSQPIPWEEAASLRDEVGDTAGDGSDFPARLAAQLTLTDAIRRLPEEFREVIWLHYDQGWKLTEIASVLHIGLPLVKYRLKRAKELLRKELPNET